MRYNYGGQDVYNLPGGNVEFGENLSETLIRELDEELSFKVNIGELLYVVEVISDKMQTIHFVFGGKIVDGTPILNPKETTALEVVWLPIKNIKDHQLYPNIASYISKLPLQTTYLGVLNQKWF
jgi:8-oxo-dGTP diphosphatase